MQRVKNEVTSSLLSKSTNDNDVESLMTKIAELSFIGCHWNNFFLRLHYKVKFSSMTPGSFISFQFVSLFVQIHTSCSHPQICHERERRSVKTSSDGVNPVEWKPYALSSVTSLNRSQSKDVRTIQGCNYGGSLKKTLFSCKWFWKFALKTYTDFGKALSMNH